MWLDVDGHTLLNLEQLTGFKVSSQNRPGHPDKALVAMVGDKTIPIEEGTHEYCFGVFKELKTAIQEGKSGVVSTREIVAKVARG